MLGNNSTNTIINILSDYIFSGIPSNLAYDLLKEGWKRWRKQSWEDFFVNSIKKTVEKEKGALLKHASADGEISVDEKALVKILRTSITDIESIGYSRFVDDRFLAGLVMQMTRDSVLIIGGNNLSEDAYAYLVNNLVRHARSYFRELVRTDENGFKMMLQDCADEILGSTQSAQRELEILSSYLDNKFDLVLCSLDYQTTILDNIQRELRNFYMLRQGRFGFPQIKRIIKVFLSSAEDVKDEHGIAIRVCHQLSLDPLLSQLIDIQLVNLDNEPFNSASQLKEDSIAQVKAMLADSDILIFVIWAQMGKLLSPEKEMNGVSYSSDLEWQYQLSLQIANMRKDKPQILVYRRTEIPLISMRDPKKEEKFFQLALVDDFFLRIQSTNTQLDNVFNPYATPEEFRNLLDAHLRKIITVQLKNEMPAEKFLQEDNAIEMKPVWQASPFPGLRSFTIKDAPIYFGRGKEIDDIVRMIEDNRFVAVVGASGSGKSSLVWAGLLPRVQEKYLSLRFTPGEVGNDPFKALAVQLKPYFEASGWDTKGLAAYIFLKPADLDNLCRQILLKENKKEILLFIDQFEELFTLISEEFQKSFIELIASINEAKYMRIVLTLRSDFYPQCLRWPQFPELLAQGHYPLSTPRLGALYEMITKPAKLVGLEFQSGLVEQILDDTGNEPGALALLAYTLDEMYQMSTQKLYWSIDQYFSSGRVQDAMGSRAEKIYSTLPEDVKLELPNVFRELVEVDISGIATRRRALLQNIALKKQSKNLIDAFINGRLLVTYSVGNSVFIDVAHEALFRNWDRLSLWIEKTQADLFLLRQMRTAAAQWNIHERKRDFLWLGDINQEVQGMLERLAPELNDVEKLFSRPEKVHLLEEIDNENTLPVRRSVIGERLNILGDSRPGIGLAETFKPEIIFCDVPEGEIQINSINFNVKKFYIAKYTITYSQFEPFLQSIDGFRNILWWKDIPSEYQFQEMDQQNNKQDNHPREKVSWYQAIAFSRWLNEKLKLNGNLTFLNSNVDYISLFNNGWSIRLPTEWEFQQAATGGNVNYSYPWGEEWEDNKANTAEAIIGRTTAVGIFPSGVSPTGAMDLSGNVWEWCLNEFRDTRETGIGGENARVLRGGSFSRSKEDAKVSARNFDDPFFRYGSFGFRVCFAPSVAQQ